MAVLLLLLTPGCRSGAPANLAQQPSTGSPVWSGLGHDSTRTGYSPVSGPTQLAERSYAEIDVRMRGYACAGAGRRYYIIGFSLQAFDAADQPLWRFRPVNGVAGNPALGADGTIYVLGRDWNLYALSPDGSLQWQIPSEMPDWYYSIDQTEIGRYADQIAVDPTGRVYATRQRTLSGDEYELLAASPTGEVLWRRVFTGWIGEPQLGPLGVYVYTPDNLIQVISPAGENAWSIAKEDPGDRTVCFAVAGDGTVAYVQGGELHVLSADGQVRWEAEYVGRYNALPQVAVDHSRVYLKPARDLLCYSSAGNLLWTVEDALYDRSPICISADGGICGFQENSESDTGNYFQVVSIDADGALAWDCDLRDSLSYNSYDLTVDEAGLIHAGSNFVYQEISSAGEVEYDHWAAYSVPRGPVIDADLNCYLAYGRTLYCFDMAGEMRWQAEFDDTINSHPVLDPRGTLMVTTAETGLHVLDMAGKQLWNFTPILPALNVSVGAGGELYLLTDGNLAYMLNAGGQPVWQYTSEKSFVATPAIAPDGTIVTIIGDRYRNTDLVAISRSGRLKWQISDIKSDYYSVPVIDADGTVYCVSHGAINAFTADGRLRWSLDGNWHANIALSPSGIIYATDASGSFLASVSDTEYYEDSNGVYAISTTGEILWYHRLHAYSYTKPVADARGNVFVGTHTGRVNAFNRYGHSLWFFWGSGDFLDWPDATKYNTGGSATSAAPYVYAPSLALAPDGTLACTNSWDMTPQDNQDEEHLLVIFIRSNTGG